MCRAELLFSNSSARAIRKTALRAYCGCRRCFAHILALSSSDYQETDSYASINPSPDNQMAELLRYLPSYSDQFIDRISSLREFLFIFRHDISLVHFFIMMQVISIALKCPACFFHLI